MQKGLKSTSRRNESKNFEILLKVNCNNVKKNTSMKKIDFLKMKSELKSVISSFIWIFIYFIIYFPTRSHSKPRGKGIFPWCGLFKSQAQTYKTNFTMCKSKKKEVKKAGGEAKKCMEYASEVILEDSTISRFIWWRMRVPGLTRRSLNQRRSLSKKG